MKHFFLLILLISIFFINQNQKHKIYKSELENRLVFNSNKLHAVIADFWNINN
jgi:hypothetical protein